MNIHRWLPSPAEGGRSISRPENVPQETSPPFPLSSTPSVHKRYVRPIPVLRNRVDDTTPMSPGDNPSILQAVCVLP